MTEVREVDDRTEPVMRRCWSCAASARRSAASSRCPTSADRFGPARSPASSGDNGAGKSTLIKVLSGVHQPDSGELRIDGRPVTFHSSRDALDAGVATVYQDLAMVPLMSIWRNFFLGSEPTRGWGPLRRFDSATAKRTTRDGVGRHGHRHPRSRSAGGNVVRWRASVCGHRSGRAFRRPPAHPGRADFGPGGQAIRHRPPQHRAGPRPGCRRHLHHPQPASRLSGRRPFPVVEAREEPGRLRQVRTLACPSSPT